MRVAVVGGGAAGQIAAIKAAQSGHSVTIYERNEKLGKKLFAAWNTVKNSIVSRIYSFINIINIRAEHSH